VDQLQEELDAARLAIVSLLAVMTDEQFQAVETALEALAPMSETAPVALEELRVLRGHGRRPLRRDQPVETSEATEPHLTAQKKSG
jgi:hypothetical protein